MVTRMLPTNLNIGYFKLNNTIIDCIYCMTDVVNDVNSDTSTYDFFNGDLRALLPVIAAFFLGLLAGPLKDMITERRKVAHIARTIHAELGAIETRVHALAVHLFETNEATSWYKHDLHLIAMWEWIPSDLLSLFPACTLDSLISLRSILYELDNSYQQIEQYINSKGQLFPKEYVIVNFGTLKSNILKDTELVQTTLEQVRLILSR